MHLNNLIIKTKTKKNISKNHRPLPSSLLRLPINSINFIKILTHKQPHKKQIINDNIFNSYNYEQKKDEDESKIDIGLCGEWTNEEGDGNLTSKEAKQVFDEVNRNVVML